VGIYNNFIILEATRRQNRDIMSKTAPKDMFTETTRALNLGDYTEYHVIL